MHNSGSIEKHSFRTTNRMRPNIPLYPARQVAEREQRQLEQRLQQMFRDLLIYALIVALALAAAIVARGNPDLASQNQLFQVLFHAKWNDSLQVVLKSCNVLTFNLSFL